MARFSFAATALALVGFLALGAAHATEYASNPNPACRAMRNAGPDVAIPAEPNRDDVAEAVRLNKQRQYARAFQLMSKIDVADTKALADLPPATPYLDQVIDNHITNLVFARSVIAHYFEVGQLGLIDRASAVAAYQRAVDTGFTDERGCVHRVRPSMQALVHLAGMYAYGIGVPADLAKAKAVFKDALDDKTRPIVEGIDTGQLPRSYQLFLEVMPKRWSDISLDEKTKIAAGILGLHIGDKPGPWLDYLIIGFFVALLGVVIGISAWELGKLTHADGKAAPRGIAALYEIARRSFDRLNLFTKSLYGLTLGLTVLRYTNGRDVFAGLLGYANSETINVLTDYMLLFSMLGIVVQGIFGMVEALRGKRTVANTGVHGGARPAAEAEAQAAARGVATTSDLRDRKFHE